MSEPPTRVDDGAWRLDPASGRPPEQRPQAMGVRGMVASAHPVAAFVGALAYGFNPFRVEHIPHLELLDAFGMPAALWVSSCRLTWTPTPTT